MQIIQNHPLTKLNTFGIKALAENYVEVHSTESLQEILDLPTYRNSPLLILGGGSNILFTKELIPGLVLKNCIQGIELVKEDSEQVYIRSGAGVNWHQFVMHCIQHKYAGAENLSLIPGNVGAGPMQNIGAYGVELKDIFYELQALNIHTNKIEHFSNADCAFGYRESVFKRTLKDQYVITSVTFCLNKTPRFNTSYGALNAELEKMGVTTLSLEAVSAAVCNIRRSKLPDPAVIGNAGSFFKNPEVSRETFEALQKSHDSIIGYPLESGHVKLAAGWLIEQCGWKGYTKGDAGVHKLQALVLVNYGQAKGMELLALSQEIMDSVLAKFGVLLEREVNIR